MDDTDHKSIAASCNNEAWNLIEAAELTTADQERLVTMAATARHHWMAVGGPGEIAHADLLFGWALARTGAGKLALEATARALGQFDGNGADWERAFARAARAAAHAAAGDEAGYARNLGLAEEIGQGLDQADARLFQVAIRPLKRLAD